MHIVYMPALHSSLACIEDPVKCMAAELLAVAKQTRVSLAVYRLAYFHILLGELLPVASSHASCSTRVLFIYPCH